MMSNINKQKKNSGDSKMHEERIEILKTKRQAAIKELENRTLRRKIKLLEMENKHLIKDKYHLKERNKFLEIYKFGPLKRLWIFLTSKHEF